jgi:hypothetical protein
MYCGEMENCRHSFALKLGLHPSTLARSSVPVVLLLISQSRYLYDPIEPPGGL